MRIGINILELNKLSDQRGIGFYANHLIESLRKYTKHKIIIIENNKITGDLDLIHYPFFDFFRSTLPIAKQYPTVVTIHDTTPIIFPKHYPAGIRGKINLFKQKIALKNVRAIITDSKSSAADIEKYLKVSSLKIFPIHLAVREVFKKIDNPKALEQIKIKHNLPSEYFIYVGDINWNKNLLNLTQAVLDSNQHIVFVGKGFEQTNLEHPELKSFKKFKEKFNSNPNLHILGFTPDAELVLLLNASSGLLLTSYYEGFGLPILEAQASGVPVITSNVSSMPEVAGNGAILVNPESVQSIKDAVESLVSNSTLRKKIIKLGFENLKQFSWKKTVEETIKVYEYAVKN